MDIPFVVLSRLGPGDRPVRFTHIDPDGARLPRRDDAPQRSELE
jgi:hypothetical protein